MNCERAAALLRGLEKNELVVETEEIEELLALGLAVEADPDDLAMLQFLQPVLREHARLEIGDPLAVQSLSHVLRETEEELKKDWYRIKTSKEELAQREASRIAMRRALALLSDPQVVAPLAKIVKEARLLAPGVNYVCCRQLGAEHYALTHKGWRIRRSLKIRLERFGQTPFKAFLASFEKNEGKMRAFSGEVGTLSANIGYVKKNREQIVIGLAKTGAPAAQALQTYQQALQRVSAPDVAVTCARNTATFGGPAQAAARLGEAEAALLGAGFPSTPLVLGCAKSLLAFDPIAKGLARFTDLKNRLEQVFGREEIVFKYAARLMSAHGLPADIVQRVMTASNLLRQLPSRGAPMTRDARQAAVALASMVREPNALTALVGRYRDVEYELVRAGVSMPHHAEADALECVACPGSPAEVVDTVATLMEQIAQGRQPERADVAVAVAFAKRFAY